MGPLGFNEILIILIIVLLLFGGKKIPELMRGLGRGMREFNDAKNNVRKEIEEGVNEKEHKSTSTQSQFLTLSATQRGLFSFYSIDQYYTLLKKGDATCVQAVQH